MSLLKVDNLSVKYSDKTVADSISFSLEEGEWLMLAGPNGAGKSTVIKAISRAVDYDGEIFYKEKNIKQYKTVELARHIGALSQTNSVGYAFSVNEVVRLGRYAYATSVLSNKNSGDDEAVENALRMTGLTQLSERSVLTLSGGELQRVFLAQLFAQNPSVLLLDEPTNNLDLVYQKEIFELLSRWLKEGERAIITVVHDLSLAKAYGRKALLLKEGKTLASGDTKAVLSDENLKKAYSMDVNAWMREMLRAWE